MREHSEVQVEESSSSRSQCGEGGFDNCSQWRIPAPGRKGSWSGIIEILAGNCSTRSE